MGMAAAAATNREWVDVWLLPLSTILIALISAIFGPQWLNRRNARATSAAQAKKDEATAAQVVEQSSVSLIKHFEHVATRSLQQIASYEEEIKEMRATMASAELASYRAGRRAQVAEEKAFDAERRATETEERLESANQQIGSLLTRVEALESRLRSAGIPLDP